MSREFFIASHLKNSLLTPEAEKTFMLTALPWIEKAGSLGVFNSSQLHEFLIMGTLLHNRPAISVAYVDNAFWTPGDHNKDERLVLATKNTQDSEVGQVAIIGRIGDEQGNRLEARIQVDPRLHNQDYVLEYQTGETSLRWFYIGAMDSTVMFYQEGKGGKIAIGSYQNEELQVSHTLWPRSLQHSWASYLQYIKPSTVEIAMRLIVLPIPGERDNISTYTDIVFDSMRQAL